MTEEPANDVERVVFMSNTESVPPFNKLFKFVSRLFFYYSVREERNPALPDKFDQE